MIKRIFASVILGIILFTGENAMAETALNAGQKSIAAAASYAARGNQAGLKQALTAGLEAGVTVNEFKEILVQVYAYCGFPRSLNALNTLMQLEEDSRVQNRKETALIMARKIKRNLSDSRFGAKFMNLLRQLTSS